MADILLKINQIRMRSIIEKIHKEKGVVYIADIDSGYLTDFMLDIKKKYNINMYIDSFTHINSDQKSEDPNHKIIKRNLVTCSDARFNSMISKKVYNKNLMKITHKDPFYNIPNAFFDIQKKDLREYYDILLITGPNSNGRNLAFVHFREHLKEGSYILLNELQKYTTIEVLRRFYNTFLEFKNILPIDRINFFRITGIK